MEIEQPTGNKTVKKSRVAAAVVSRRCHTAALWGHEEVSALEGVITPNVVHGKVQWKPVLAGWRNLFPQSNRTLCALQARWRLMKEQREATQTGPAQPVAIPETTEDPRVDESVVAAGSDQVTRSPARGDGIMTSDDPVAFTETTESNQPAELDRPVSSLTQAMTDPQLARHCEGDSRGASCEPSYQPSENGPTVEKERSPEPIPDAWRTAYSGYLRVALSGRPRPPGKRGLRNVSAQELAWADQLVKERVARYPQDLTQLNAAVYSAAKTVERMRPEHQNRQGRLLDTMEMSLTNCRRNLGWISAELQRRRQGKPATPHQSWILRQLRKDFGWKKVHARTLSCKYEEIVQRIHCLRQRSELLESQQGRRKVRSDYAVSKRLAVPKPQLPEEGPGADDVHKYWSGVLGQVAERRESVEVHRWYKAMRLQCREVMERDGNPIDPKCFEAVVRKAKAWKSPGPDGICNFWWKVLPTAKRMLYSWIGRWCKGGVKTPRWFALGRTVLIHKGGEAKDPACYRPIACLNTCYKLMTGSIAKILGEHVCENNVLPESQRSLRKGTWGTVHALLIDRTVVLDARRMRKPLSMAWIDFKKAFDSVPHDHLLQTLQAIRAPGWICRGLKELMRYWKTVFVVRSAGGLVHSLPVKYKRGLFQGDSLSPLLYCLSTAPISWALDVKGGEPYKTSLGKLRGHELSLTHQAYVDDIKLYSKSTSGLRASLKVVHETGEACGMVMGLDKCAQVHKTRKGERLPAMETTLPDNESSLSQRIHPLADHQTYKYLGIQQHIRAADQEVLGPLRHKFLERARTVFCSELSTGQKCHAFKMCCIGLVRYYFYCGIASNGRLETHLRWCEKLDVEVRKLLVKTKSRYRSSCVARLYLPRHMGGGGLLSLVDEYLRSVLAVGVYLQRHQDMAQCRGILASCKHGDRSPWRDFREVLSLTGLDTKVNLEDMDSLIIDGKHFGKVGPAVKALTSLFAMTRSQNRLKQWRDLPSAGRIIQEGGDISLKDSFLWLERGCMSSVNERNGIGVQEHVIGFKAHASHREQGDSVCRKCHSTAETAAHVVSNCRNWVRTLYLDRHNSVAQNLYYRLCLRYGLPAPIWPDRPKAVAANEKGKLLWDMPVCTNTPLAHNRPDIVEFNHVTRELIIWEVGVSFVSCLKETLDRKVYRYSVNGTVPTGDLTVDWERRGANLLDELKVVYREYKVSLQPVIIGTCGEVLPALRTDLSQRFKDLRAREVECLLERLQRSAVIGTSRVVRNHLA
ncbi:MAG: hypothetical protein GY737_20585 [Desulfobacteraceae bacterium]|nr:hypothetical protein [Desulfobacteraceae bacterium]